MSTRNYARFYALLNRIPCTDRDELKSSLVFQYTDGRTNSLKEVTDKEYNMMCQGMQDMVSDGKIRQLIRENMKRKRSSVLHQLQKMGINTADWNSVDSYCRNPRIAGKVFRNLTEDELDMLFIKLKMIQRKENDKGDKSLLN